MAASAQAECCRQGDEHQPLFPAALRSLPGEACGQRWVPSRKWRLPSHRKSPDKRFNGRRTQRYRRQ